MVKYAFNNEITFQRQMTNVTNTVTNDKNINLIIFRFWCFSNKNIIFFYTKKYIWLHNHFVFKEDVWMKIILNLN